MEFTDHYTLVETDGDHVHHTLEAAKAAASGDDNRIWFIRGGDGPECTCIEEGGASCECDLEDVWDVQLWVGQFVNCTGFFVTTEPCRPEHDNSIFTY